jgi:hypothetical protein
MKSVNLDFKSLVIGILFTSLCFLTIGASSTPIIVKSDCDENEIISRILFCIDGARIIDGRISTYCNS